jgi:ABC-2 type transport system permease protein
MSKAILVAQREFMENVRTKTFWIGILSFPVLLTALIVVPMWLEKTKDVRKYAVVDNSGWLLPEVESRADFPDLEKLLLGLKKNTVAQRLIAAALPNGGDQLTSLSDEQIKFFAKQMSAPLLPEGSSSQVRAALPPELGDRIPQMRESLRRWWRSLPAVEARKIDSGLAKSRYQRVDVSDLGPDPLPALNAKIDKEQLFAYFVVGQNPVASAEGCKYVSNNLTDDSLENWFSGLATEAVRERRIAEAKIEPAVAKHIQEPVRFESKKIGKGGKEAEVKTQDKVRQFAPVAFVYLLWISVFTIAQMLLTNTIEEKSNRIIEVLLSSVSPIQLMAGKIAGIAATGLTVLGSWVLFFFVGVKLAPKLAGGPLPFDLSIIISDPVYLPSFIAYFLLGYLLYAAILVGLGSVCNSLKEAQNLLQPVMLLLIVPLIAMMPIVQDPNGTLAKVLSYIPVFTPFVMMNRTAAPPTLTEYVITTILLLLSIGAALYGAAKIFRIGILMTGKPPKIREIFQWMRAPVGAVPVKRDA